MAHAPLPPFNALQLKAQNILRAAARATPAQAMASPPAMIGPCIGLSSLTIAAGGTGWTTGDTFTVNGGTLQSGGAAAIGKVTAQSGGVATAIALTRGGEYTSGNAPGNGASTTRTAGSGAGLTVNVVASGSPVFPGKTSVAGQQQILLNDARLGKLSGLTGSTISGTVNTQTGEFISRTAGSAAFNGAKGGGTNGWGIGFGTDSQTVDFVASKTAAAFIVYVTDLTTGVRQRAQANDYVINDNGTLFYKIDFGARKPRYLEFYFSDKVNVRGFDIEPTASLWKYQPPAQIAALAIADSYGEGQQAANITRGSHVYVFGELIGAPNIVSNSVAAAGVLRQGTDNLASAYDARVLAGNIAPGFIGAMDLVALFGSINDIGPNTDGSGTTITAAMVTAAWTTLVQHVRAAQPGAIIVVFGQQNPNNTASQAYYDALAAGVAAGAAGDPRVLHVDVSPNGDPIQTGTGYSGGAAGSGNGDFYVGADHIHPNDAGYQFIGARQAQLALRAIKTIAGL